MTQPHDPAHAPGPDLVRPATPEEEADTEGWHAANRMAWDEAAERYEGWFDEAVEMIRSAAATSSRWSRT